MDKIAYRLFLFLLFFSPLAFGAVELWSLTLMEGLTFLMVGLYLLNCILKEQPLYQTPGALPLILFLAYLLFQMVPLPPGVISWVSPKSSDIYQQTIGTVEPAAWLPISINKKASLQEFFRYAAYVSFYFLSVQILTNKKKLKTAIYTIIIFSSLLAVFALIQKYTSNSTIYWLRKISGNVVIFGPYLNHNHFAGLMEMMLPIVLSLFLYLKPRIKYEMSLREKIVEIFDSQGSNVYLLLGFSAILLATAIVVSFSRGAIISICLALIFFILLLNHRSNKRKHGNVLLLFSLAVVLSISWFGWDTVFERFDRLSTRRGLVQEARLVFWIDSVKIIEDFPVTGIGFGNFGNIYPRYRTFRSSDSVQHAHNDYLELLIEGGLIGATLVSWFLFVVLIKTYRIYRQRRERYSIYLYLGCVTGIISLLFHSTTDFNTHIGANGLYFFFLIGVLVSAANTKFREDPETTLLRKVEMIQIKLLVFNLVTVALMTGLFFNVRILLGRVIYSSIEKIYLNPQIPQGKKLRVREVARRSSVLDPYESKYYYAQANMDVILLKWQSAVNNYKKAIYYDPLQGEYLQRFGLVLSWLNNPDMSERLLIAGVKNDVSNPERYKTYAGWLFSQKKRERAVEYLGHALSLEPVLTTRRIREYLIMMIINDLSDQEMIDVMSQTAGTLLGLANYWYGAGKNEQAAEAYLFVKNRLEEGGILSISQFKSIISFYLQQGKNEVALRVSSKAVELYPNNAWARIYSARMYTKMGITYRAVQEYKTALAFDPSNSTAIKELQKIITD